MDNKKTQVLYLISLIFIPLILSLFISLPAKNTRTLVLKDIDNSYKYQPDEFYFTVNLYFSYIQYNIIYNEDRPIYYLKYMELYIIINNNTVFLVKEFSRYDVPGDKLITYSHTGIYSYFTKLISGNIQLNLRLSPVDEDIEYKYYSNTVFVIDGLLYFIFFLVIYSIAAVYVIYFRKM